ncbi:MAG: GNAT family N-acetyltransferase [Verrucomicrobia bacterium]|nr:GNAT family N-acetyltransferase [Verrucomicrobiota bacterium]
MKIEIIQGREILTYIHKLATLRISVFREYPYLYDGTLDYEEEYLLMYVQSKESIWIVVEEKGKMIGAVTGLPLIDAIEEIKNPFLKDEKSIKDIFYLGEILLLKEYRKSGIGYELYRLFEKKVQSFEHYKKITLCEVKRPGSDVRRPDDYVPLDSLWNRQGFIKQGDKVSYLSWKEIGSEEEMQQPMVFWMKSFS